MILVDVMLFKDPDPDGQKVPDPQHYFYLVNMGKTLWKIYSPGQFLDNRLFVCKNPASLTSPSSPTSCFIRTYFTVYWKQA